MNIRFVLRATAGLMLATAFTSAALAQATAAEILGQPVQVTTNGVTNTIYLDPGGTARILTPGGNTVPGRWTAANGQLCLNNGAAQECWPYSGPFQAGQSVSLTSSCGQTSTWLAAATNAPPPPPPTQGQKGERGR
jgi:hypothetical protein